MLIAKNEEGKRILPKPKTKANCQICGSEVIPKCGEINIWHWAHKNMIECDSWSEESEWHLSWKRLCKDKFVEVIVGKHRADIFNGVFFIELQKNSLASYEIRDRENYYKKMIWIFFLGRNNNLVFRERKGYYTFRWKWPKRSLVYCKNQIFFDLDDGRLFKVNNIYFTRFCGGSGNFIDKEDFIKIYLKNVLKK